MAQVRGSASQGAPIPTHEAASTSDDAEEEACEAMSRTVEWWRRKKTARVAGAKGRLRKEYSCCECGQVMSLSTGHTQFHGKRYCPLALGQVPKEQWLAERLRQVPRLQLSVPASLHLHVSLFKLSQYHTLLPIANAGCLCLTLHSLSPYPHHCTGAVASRGANAKATAKVYNSLLLW